MKISRGAALARLIEDFCQLNGTTVRRFALSAGIQPSTISAWKKGAVIPETRSLEATAEKMGLEFESLWTQLNLMVEQDAVTRASASLEEMSTEDLIRLISKATRILEEKFVAA